MSKILNNLRLIMRIYAVALLVAAAVRSSPALAFAPVVPLVWFLYQWRWPSSHLVDFLTQYFVFFAAGLLLSAALNPYVSVLISLPLIVPVDLKLRHIGRLPDSVTRKRSVTNTGIVIIGITAGLTLVGLLVSSTPLLLACAAASFISLIVAWFHPAKGCPPHPWIGTPFSCAPSRAGRPKPGSY